MKTRPITHSERTQIYFFILVYLYNSTIRWRVRVICKKHVNIIDTFEPTHNIEIVSYLLRFFISQQFQEPPREFILLLVGFNL